IDHDRGGGIFQLGDDLLPGRFLFEGQKRAQRVLVAHMVGVTVKDAAHFHDRAGEGDFFAENLGAIGRGEYGAADVEADLAPVDIERGDHFEVRRSVWPDLAMHQADPSLIPRGAVATIYRLNAETRERATPSQRDS